MAQFVLQLKNEDRKSKILPAVLRDVSLLLVAMWLGAAVFFSFALAPVLFGVLPTRELAGAVIGRLLPLINIAGFVIGLALFVSSLLAKNLTVSRARRRTEAAAFGVMTVAAAAGEWLIGRRIGQLRQQMMGVPIDQLAPDDALRLAFGQMHRLSVLVLIIAMLAAIIALLLIASREVKTKSV